MSNSIFIAEQLNYVQGVVIKQDFPEMLMASGAAVGVSREIPAGAETYSYKIMTMVGEAAILANGSDDIPLVNGFCETRYGQIKTLVDAYSYTVEDIEAAQFAGINLNAELGVAAREVIERKFDNLAYTGDSRFSLLGFLNQPNVPVHAILNDGNINGGVNSTRWRHKTSDQIYRDLVSFSGAMRIATGGAYFIEAIALSEEDFNIANTTPYPVGSPVTTLLSFFLSSQKATPSGVQSVFPMAALGGAGAGGTNMMVGYQKRDDRIKLHMPLDFTQMPVQVNNFTYKVPCRMRTGGIQLTKPLSMRYATGL